MCVFFFLLFFHSYCNSPLVFGSVGVPPKGGDSAMMRGLPRHKVTDINGSYYILLLHREKSERLHERRFIYFY